MMATCFGALLATAAADTSKMNTSDSTGIAVGVGSTAGVVCLSTVVAFVYKPWQENSTQVDQTPEGVKGELNEHGIEIDDPKLAGAPPEVVRDLVSSGVAGPCSSKVCITNDHVLLVI